MESVGADLRAHRVLALKTMVYHSNDVNSSVPAQLRAQVPLGLDAQPIPSECCQRPGVGR